MGTNAEIGVTKLRNVYVERPADGAYQPGEDARVALSLFTGEPIRGDQQPRPGRPAALGPSL